MRIAVIGSPTFPSRPPFAGGLEAHTWQLATGLRRRGHDVAVLDVDLDPDWRPTGTSRRDVSSAPEEVVRANHVLMSVVRAIADEGDFDVVHNNSTHHLPVAMAPLLGAPLVTTLHSPPTPWLESAFRLGGQEVAEVVSVSAANAAAWRATVTASVIHNGVDCGTWTPSAERRSGAVWIGRLVPEKAPHLAIEAARAAGMDIVLAGPAHDPAYFDVCIRPLLDGDRARYAGHLAPDATSRLLASAEVCLVTPVWEEPFGLVVAEALACGTPVAAFRSGALPELIDDEVGCLVPTGDVVALGEVVSRAAGKSSERCRARAVERFSVQRMLDDYERTFAAAA